MYIADRIGTHRGRITGTRYKLIPGHVIPAPPGDLHGLPGVTWLGEDPEPAPPSRQGMEVVIPQGVRSTSYPVARVVEMARDMNPDNFRNFTQGDSRKTVLRILSE